MQAVEILLTLKTYALAIQPCRLHHAQPVFFFYYFFLLFLIQLVHRYSFVLLIVLANKKNTTKTYFRTTNELEMRL
jgi:hypothetical protein